MPDETGTARPARFFPWSRAAERARAGRITLSRDQIVDAAISVMDEEGLDALSMRRLGQELDAGATSLYWHIRNKDELLDLVLDRVIGEVVPDMPHDAGWRETAEQAASALRRVLLRHRGVAPIMGERPTFGPNALQALEILLTPFVKAGFEPEAALLAATTIINWASGFAVFEVRDPVGPNASDADRAAFVSGVLGVRRDTARRDLPDDPRAPPVRRDDDGRPAVRVRPRAAPRRDRVVPGGRDGCGRGRRMTVAEPARHLPLDGTRNVRDVGGYPAADGRRTRWRTLLRSDELTRLDERAQRELLDLGIRHVVDLRWPEELDESPNVFVRSRVVRYTSVPLLEDDPTPHAGLAGMYRHVFDMRSAQLAQVARALLADGGLPAVIGCAAGKDRTGVAIALLLDLVGVPHTVIVEDYALSAGYFSDPVTRVEAPDWRHPPLAVESPPEYMASALEHLDRAHGGARALLRREGIPDADIERLIERLTEPAEA